MAVQPINPDTIPPEALAIGQYFRSMVSEEELKAVTKQYLNQGWPSKYENVDTKKIYRPHNEREAHFVYTDGPRQYALLGGEGAGKSCAGIIKTLDRLRRGCDGALVSPDLVHFSKSVWPEFKRWCPWHKVIDRHKYREQAGWEPSKAFQLVFENDVGTTSTLLCGGCKESEIKSWEGPNINFVHMDEMRRHTSAIALKTFLGRVRIPGPNGEPPQLYITTTPLKNWLFEFFGPMECKCVACNNEFKWDLAPNTIPVCDKCQSTNFTTEDIWRDFKLKTAVIRLRTEDNEANLQVNFASERALSLTETEARVLLDAEWEDIEDTERYLPSILLWDLCKVSNMPELTPNEPMVLGIDAAKGRKNTYSDCFAIVGVTRHWDKDKRRNHVAVRFCQTWQARPGKFIDFQGIATNPGPELVIRQLCKDYNVIQVAYDDDELHDLGNRLRKERLAWFAPFSQMGPRAKADSDLLRLIQERRIVHAGDLTLREHLSNADRKVSPDGHRLRIVKRIDSLKVDAAVSLSMAADRVLYLNLP
jgi:hypothetical protein